MELERQNTVTRYLSFWLRHGIHNECIPHDNGHISIQQLIDIDKNNPEGIDLTSAEIQEALSQDKRNRFTLTHEGLIRANYGHSFEVDTQAEPSEPPKHLYFTVDKKILDSVLENGFGLVHKHNTYLFETADQALDKRSEKTQYSLLKVNAGQMHQDGESFQRQGDGVWLGGKGIAGKYLSEVKLKRDKDASLEL